MVFNLQTMRNYTFSGEMELLDIEFVYVLFCLCSNKLSRF